MSNSACYAIIVEIAGAGTILVRTRLNGCLTEGRRSRRLSEPWNGPSSFYGTFSLPQQKRVNGPLFFLGEMS